MENKKLTHLVSAPLFPRVFAGILDAVMIVFVAGGLYIAGGAISKNIPSVQTYQESMKEKMVASGLVSYDTENEGYSLNQQATVIDYQNEIYSFYNSFYSNEKEDGKTRDIYWFNVHIMGQEDTRNLYASERISSTSYIQKFGKELFTYKLDLDGAPLLDEFALPIAYSNDPNGASSVTKEKNDELLAFFYKSDEMREELDEDDLWRDYVLYHCLSDLTGLSSIQSLYENYYLFTTTLPLIIAIFLSLIIFLIVVPICMKNGETIGKKIMGISLVNSLGYSVLRMQSLLRSGFSIFGLVIVVLFVGINYVSLALIGLVSLTSFLMMIFSKKHTAIHDLLAGTSVVEKKASTWFKNIEEETKAEQFAGLQNENKK